MILPPLVFPGCLFVQWSVTKTKSLITLTQVGAVITILVRSSSVFTSTLTPLCATGLVSLETAYPLTLGSNIGTTTTSILASFAAEGKYLKPSIQVSTV